MYPKLRTTAALLGVGAVAGMLASCSAAAGQLERVVIEQAERTGPTFVIPVRGTELEQWRQVVILCPYKYQPEDLEPRFARAIRNPNDVLDEESQWLIFAKQDETRMLRLSRDKVDFCAGEEVSTNPYGIDQPWTGEKVDGTWLIRPAE